MNIRNHYEKALISHSHTEQITFLSSECPDLNLSLFSTFMKME